ncbi:MAG: hypothetical protein J6K55_01110, partial [Clostridia bacterium]|nr:hypothetical protein [Clostridia bacterium]
MSDYYRNQQSSRRMGGENGSWQQDASFLSDAPAQLGEQMQQGGVPLFGSGADFMADDAPTRVGRPVVNQQLVSKRTTAQPAPVQPEPEAPRAEEPAGEQPVRRRRSRVAERAAAEAAQTGMEQPQADPFRAGDSEEPARVYPQAAPAPRAMYDEEPARRPVPQ